jgi:hypothetical protein
MTAPVRETAPGAETEGRLSRTVTGSMIAQTEIAWRIRKARNLRKFARLSSKRASLPILSIRMSK